jgi:hypothetical protein
VDVRLCGGLAVGLCLAVVSTIAQCSSSFLWRSPKLAGTIRRQSFGRVRPDPHGRDWYFHCLTSCILRGSSTRAPALLPAAYLIPNIALARRKGLWEDEFFTLYLAKPQNWRNLWGDLSMGTDQHPASFCCLTRLIFRVAGTGSVTLHLTALVGFGLCCVCLYEIARRRAARPESNAAGPRAL